MSVPRCSHPNYKISFERIYLFKHLLSFPSKFIKFQSSSLLTLFFFFNFRFYKFISYWILYSKAWKELNTKSMQEFKSVCFSKQTKILCLTFCVLLYAPLIGHALYVIFLFLFHFKLWLFIRKKIKWQIMIGGT